MAKLLTVARQLASLNPAEQKFAVSFARDLSARGGGSKRAPRAARKAKKAPAYKPKPKPKVKPIDTSDTDDE